MEPSSGRIVIDGIDTSTIGLFDLRSRLALVPQASRISNKRWQHGWLWRGCWCGLLACLLLSAQRCILLRQLALAEQPACCSSLRLPELVLDMLRPPSTFLLFDCRTQSFSAALFVQTWTPLATPAATMRSGRRWLRYACVPRTYKVTLYDT